MDPRKRGRGRSPPEARSAGEASKRTRTDTRTDVEKQVAELRLWIAMGETPSVDILMTAAWPAVRSIWSVLQLQLVVLAQQLEACWVRTLPAGQALTVTETPLDQGGVAMMRLLEDNVEPPLEMPLVVGWRALLSVLGLVEGRLASFRAQLAECERQQQWTAPPAPGFVPGTQAPPNPFLPEEFLASTAKSVSGLNLAQGAPSKRSGFLGAGDYVCDR